MGLFISFEGPEGSGKTTQIMLLARWLAEQGFDVLATREPGGTPIGDRVRAVLLDAEHRDMLPQTEILLFSAARAQHVGQVIRPHLACGGIVLCDRFADSTLAYQGYGRQLDLATLRSITEFATGGLWPDLTLFLDLPVDVGLARKAAGAGVEWNRMEQEALDFHHRVRAGYLAMAQADAQRWLVLDANRPADVIQQAVQQRVRSLLASRSTSRELKRTER